MTWTDTVVIGAAFVGFLIWLIHYTDLTRRPPK